MIFIVAVGIALLVASFFMLGGVDFEVYNRSQKELWNLGHVLYFALVTLLLTRIPWIKPLILPWRWFSLLLFTLVFGFLIEWLQLETIRSFDLMDVVRDLSGCLLVLAFYPGYLRFKTLLWPISIRIAVLLLSAWLMFPLYRAMTDEEAANSAFPVLSDFATPFQLQRWSGEASISRVRLLPEQSGHQMAVRLSTARYSGTGLDYFPGDWSGFRYLQLSFYHPLNKPLALTVRVHDRQHEQGEDRFRFNDRFNRRVILTPGWNSVRLDLNEIQQAPRGRNMDLQTISDVSFFASRLRKAQVLYLDKIELVK